MSYLLDLSRRSARAVVQLAREHGAPNNFTPAELIFELGERNSMNIGRAVTLFNVAFADRVQELAPDLSISYRDRVFKVEQTMADQVNTPERDPDLELLSQAITASGLTLGRFAREVMIRDELTVRRWLSGETQLPAAVRDWLHHQ